ncbi:hypothetical protein SAMN04487907_102320 [Zunongwangia mangrovi]|uniref:Uncharacterized protein n=1 Tax=Zunongwangia mangrovi TaxID=1334022 RepID=A0A1I1GK98_9FLAO|nr:hypothetical protein [Zunongwangia mangrovi]SFC12199.1 hypothetical protein SAMN04487907_102320 [Zunongwangia mangrovi]|tara:strand:- start:36 stop:239 length:204 start_codon:yes stop_codon:yes gene_type:complete
MAEIRIEKKKQIWPWIIVIIVVGVLAFLYFYGSAQSDNTEDNSSLEEIGQSETQASSASSNKVIFQF